MAALEEFLQQKYLDLFDEVNEDDNKVVSMINNTSTSGYFYKPTVGALLYVVDSEGHALYLINKSGLPQEIKEGLVGGDAGKGEYTDYAGLRDVYGVTTNLKVYYCSSGLDTIVGLGKYDLDKDNPEREVFSSESALGNLITGGSGEPVTAEQAKIINELTVTGNLTNLKDIYNLPSLKTLIFDNATLESLDGIENVLYIETVEFLNYDTNKIKNYDKLNTINTLNKLYLVNSNDEQVEDVFTAMKATIYNDLEYLGVYDSGDRVTDISVLKEWNKITKEKIKYLYFYNNKLTDISCFEYFSNVTTLWCYDNKIASLTPCCNNMYNLISIWAYGNDLTDNPQNNEYSLKCFEDKTCPCDIRLNRNSNLQYIGFFKNMISFLAINLEACPNLLGSEVALIADLYNNCSPGMRSINSEFQKFLNSESILIYNGENLNDDSEDINYLKNMTEENCKKVKAIRLQDNPNLSNEILQTILRRFPNIESINVNNCNNLNSLNFTSNTQKLVELLFLNTAVTDLTPLNNITTFKSIECNNSDFNGNGINIATIQQTLSRLTRDIGNKNMFYNTGSTRIHNLASQLEKCQNLTSVELSQLEYSGIVDLSNLSVEKVYVGTYGCFVDELILPSSIGRLRLRDYNMVNFSNVNFIDTIVVEGDRTDNINLFAECCYNIEKYNIKCNGFCWYRPGLNSKPISYTNKFTKESLTGISLGNMLNKLKNSNVKYIAFGYTTFWIDGINIPTVDGQDSTSKYALELDFNDLDLSEGFDSLEVFNVRNLTINSLDCFSGCKNLKHLWLENCEVKDINGLEGCENLLRIYLKNNQISNVYGLRNLKNLKELNLENNVLWDEVTIDSGTKINNLEIFADLNKTGSLKKLFILNNVGIINKEILQNLQWEQKSGF